MKFASAGPVDEVDELAAQMARARQEVGPGACLGIVYLPYGADYERTLRRIQRSVDLPLIGGTTGGAAFTERGFTDHGAAGAVLGGDSVSARVVLATEVRTDPERSLRGALERLGVVQGNGSQVLVLADAFACDGEAMVQALRNEIPPKVRYFGGTTGDDWNFSGAFVFQDDRAYQDAAVFTCLSGVTEPVVDALHGFCAAPGAREFTITRCRGNVVVELDNRAAVQVYEEELRRLGVLDAHAPIDLHVTGVHELGTPTPFGERLKIRVPLAMTSEGITLASSLELGSTVQVVSTDQDNLIAAASALASRSHDALKRAPQAALVFDCAARHRLLAKRYSEQLDAFGGEGSYPLLGMACYGEIARPRGSVEGFHNTTAVMAAW